MLEQQCKELLQAPVENLGYRLLGIKWVTGGPHAILRLYIDNTQGFISLEDCAQVSIQVSALLDVADFINLSYHLEVSSPGLDRPLFNAEDYSDFLGHEITVKLRNAPQQRRNLRGTIQKVVGDNVTLAMNDKNIEINLHNVQSAHLVPKFQ